MKERGTPPPSVPVGLRTRQQETMLTHTRGCAGERDSENDRGLHQKFC